MEGLKPVLASLSRPNVEGEQFSLKKGICRGLPLPWPLRLFCKLIPFLVLKPFFFLPPFLFPSCSSLVLLWAHD